MPAGKSHVPAGYNVVMPYLRIKGAAKAIEFYKAAFGAKEKFRLMMPDGKIGHAEISIGGAAIMLSEEFPDFGAVGPATLNGTSVALLYYVANADAAFAKAIAAGGKVKRPLTDEFYGCRTGQIEDPFGHVWFVQQHIENVTPKKMQKRLDAMMAGGTSEPAAEAAAKPKAKAKAKR